MSIFLRYFTKTPVTQNLTKKSIIQDLTTAATSTSTSSTSKMTSAFSFKTSPKTPLYFFSHGGPTFGDREDDFGGDAGAYDKVHEIGTLIKNKVKPDFIIVISAHWQSNGANTVEVAIPDTSNSFRAKSEKLTPDENDLIYDFYGFPSHMYKQQFHTVGSEPLANDIVKTLTENGFKSSTVKRGIDHGVWVPFRVAFTDARIQDTGKPAIDVPLIQVSLTGSNLIEPAVRLGKALSSYRQKNGVIICSGMSVHNLRDIGRAMGNGNRPLPYTPAFNKLLTKILTSSNDSSVVAEELENLEKLSDLRKLYISAHPTPEHFLPVAVGVGASNNDTCKELYSKGKGSLGWNVYEWSS